MQNEDNFDKRYKYRLKEKSSFYIYRRNKKNNIYYVRYKNGRTVSTGKTSLKQAYIYAQVFFDTSLKQEKKSEIASKNAKITLNEIIVNYY